MQEDCFQQFDVQDILYFRYLNDPDETCRIPSSVAAFHDAASSFTATLS